MLRLLIVNILDREEKIMTEWVDKKLGEITSFIAKGIPPKYVEEETQKTVRVLNQKCNRNYEISYDESRIHNAAIKKVPEDKYLRYGDVLINSTGTGTAGRVAQVFNVPVSTTIDGHMILIRPTDEIDSLYYGYAVKNYQKKIESLAEGSTGQTEINRQRLQDEIVIRFPKKKELQKSIGTFLFRIDEKIKNNNRINNNLEQQASTLFSNVLQRSTSVFYVELGALADVKGGKRLPKGISLITVPNQHPYIRVRDLNNTVFASLSNDYEYIDDVTQKSISRYIVTTGDVLISIVGTIGLTAIVDHTLNKANLTENCVKLTNLKKVTPEYLLLFLRSSQGIEAIRKGTVGAVQLKLPIKNIQSIAVPLLRDEELLPLNETLSAIFSQISANIVEMKQLADIRNTLLPRLMSGELDVSNIDL